MLNLTSFDKTIKRQKCCFVCKCNHCDLSAYISVIVFYCMGIFLSVRPVDQQRKQLAVTSYSKWCYAMSEIDVLARRFRLALNRYIVCGSANVKL